MAALKQIENDLVSYRVPVADILRSWDPFKAWNVGKITFDDVLSMSETDIHVNRGADPIPYEETKAGQRKQTRAAMRLRHIARIAYLVTHVDETPIDLEVGCPSLSLMQSEFLFEVSDGNHRLAAAVIRNDDEIVVYPGGELDYFESLFPTARGIEEPVRSLR